MATLPDLFEHFGRAEKPKHTQFRTGIVTSLVGRGRLMVQLESCEGSVPVATAQSHPCGGEVIVGGVNGGPYTALPVAPRRGGPKTAVTITLNRAIPAPPPLTELIGILVDLSLSPPVLYSVLYDETGVPLEVLASMPERSDTIGNNVLGTSVSSGGIVLINAARNRPSSRDYIRAFDPRAGLVGEYLWPYPAPNPFLHSFKFSRQTTLGTRVYWVELNFDNGAETYTWDLVSAEAADISSTSSEGSFTLPYSNLAPSVEDPFMQSPRGPFFDGGVWNLDVTVRYHDGVQTVSPGKSLSVSWAPDVESLFPGATTFVSPVGLVDGNLGFHEPPGTDPLAARYLTSRDISLVWPASGLTSRPVSLFALNPALKGINYTIPLTDFPVDGSFEFREGDITDGAPVINVVDCQDPSGLTGGGPLNPLVALRG